jgi:tetratricopeptide (TPR) repeat protein
MIGALLLLIFPSHTPPMQLAPEVRMGIDLLRSLAARCPGLPLPSIEAARALAAVGRPDEAIRCLEQALTVHRRSAAILLMLAKIEAKRGVNHAGAADRALEQAVAADFSIRGALQYRLVRAQVNSQLGRMEEAREELVQLSALPEVRKLVRPAGSVPPLASLPDPHVLTDADRLSVFVLLGQLHGRSNRMKEAKEVFALAKSCVSGSPLEPLLLLASAQFSVDRRDFDQALKLLDRVPESSPAHPRAQSARAEILLTHMRDQDGYIRCFQVLAERNPSVQTHCALGDACLRVLRPEMAVTAFEAACALEKSNARLKGKVAGLLASMNEYFRAIEGYEAAIKDALPAGAADAVHLSQVSRATFCTVSVGSLVNFYCHQDLARLLLRLGRVEAASRTLARVLHESHTDVTDMRQDVTTLTLLAEARPGVEHGAEPLGRAIDLQRQGTFPAVI